MRVSIPLRGTSRLTLSTSGPAAGRPSRARVLARSMGASGTKRVVSTPGGTWAIGGRSSPPSAASLRFGIAAGGDEQGGLSEHPASSGRVPGRRPGTVTSEPCSTAAYGSPRPDRSARAAGPDRGPRPRPRPRRPGAGPGGPAPGSGAGPAPGSARSGTPAPGQRGRRRRAGVVSTVTSSGGSRRHSSHRYDWMPADLGGEVVGDEQVAGHGYGPARRRVGPAHAGTARAAVISARPPVGRGRASRARSRSGGPGGPPPTRRGPARWDRRQPRALTRAAMTAGVGRVAGVTQHDQGVAPHVARFSARDVPPAHQLHQAARRRRPAGRGRPPTAGRPARRRGGGCVPSGQAVDRDTPSGSRRTRRGGRRGPPGTRAGTRRAPAPARPGSGGRRAARRRRGRRSGRPTGSASQGPHPSGTAGGAGVPATSGASVTTEPSTNQDPGAGEEHVGVLPVPADPRPDRGRPVDQGVVVDQRPGPASPGASGARPPAPRAARSGW